MRRISKKLFSVLVCFGFIFLLTGYGNKTALSSEEFKSQMEGNDFVV